MRVVAFQSSSVSEGPEYQIENVQNRALRIIFPAMKYIDAISMAKLTK